MQRYIPQAVLDIVGNAEYTLNDIGMSDSEVLIFRDYVLKIQQRSAETDNEHSILEWLGGRLPAPKIPAYIIESGTAYTLMTVAKGKMLCDTSYMREPERLLDIVAEGLKVLWSVDISDCPCTVSRLDERLKAARYNVEHGLVDMDNVEPGTFGPNGFRDPEELLLWLENHRPEEDLVMTHGDFCLPNIFAEGDEISCFIDLGKAGPADRWQDVAICLRSLWDNFAGHYSGEHKFEAFEPEMLLRRLGIEMNEEKRRYYTLLDELF